MRARARDGKSISWIHDGRYTISHGGEHRTFEVRTQSQDKDFAPGERIVSLLTGPDNTSNYQGFGFVKDTGIVVWKKRRGETTAEGYKPSAFEWYADMLASLAGNFDSRFGKCYDDYVLDESTWCCACGRELTDPESIRLGIGPVCRERGL